MLFGWLRVDFSQIPRRVGCQVVSSAFEGVSKIQRQRQVQEMRCLSFCGGFLLDFDEVYF